MKTRYTTEEEYTTQREIIRSRGVPLSKDNFCANTCPSDDEFIDEVLHDDFEAVFGTFEKFLRMNIRFRNRDQKYKEYR